jgi:hypothetical protein
MYQRAKRRVVVQYKLAESHQTLSLLQQLLSRRRRRMRESQYRAHLTNSIMTDQTDPSRRAILQSASALALAQLASEATASTQPKSTPPKAPTGKAGDFDFLAGNWKMQNRRLKTLGTDDWDTFEGEATVWTILGGITSIEELRIPARNFSGSGIRILNIKERVWNDYWVNSKDGVLGVPPSSGWFVDGAGNFDSEWTEGTQVIKSRGVWDRITPNSCRWHQLSSKDGGRTWVPNWFMDWTRVK